MAMASCASITSSVAKFALTGFMLAALATTGAEARGWFGAGNSTAQETIALADLGAESRQDHVLLETFQPLRGGLQLRERA